MKHVYVILLCSLILVFSIWDANAEDSFPEFLMSDIRVYVPIEQIIHGYQEDLEHEIGFNFSYNIHGQLFPEPAQGHIQALAEGFSGKTDKGTPWKTLTELLSAYHHTDIEMVKSVYTAETQEYITQFLSDPNVKERFIQYMNAVKGMRVILGFEHKHGFVAFIELDYGEAAENRYSQTYFFFVRNGVEYLLSRVTLDEAITANIATFLQLEHDVSKLVAPKYGLSIEKIGAGRGKVNGTGIDCGEDCIEVYVEGTALWLKAEADQYSTFEGWQVNGQPLSDRLVIKEDTTVTAVFNKIPPKEYTLTIAMAGDGTGAVTDSDAACEAEDASCLELFSFYAGAEEAPVELVGMDCGDTCSATYTEGTTVYLHAAAAEGSEFVEWQVNGTAVAEPLEISGDTTLTAVFDLIEASEAEEKPGEEPSEPQPDQTHP